MYFPPNESNNVWLHRALQHLCFYCISSPAQLWPAIATVSLHYYRAPTKSWKIYSKPERDSSRVRHVTVRWHAVTAGRIPLQRGGTMLRMGGGRGPPVGRPFTWITLENSLNGSNLTQTRSCGEKLNELLLISSCTSSNQLRCLADHHISNFQPTEMCQFADKQWLWADMRKITKVNSEHDYHGPLKMTESEDSPCSRAQY